MRQLTRFRKSANDSKLHLIVWLMRRQRCQLHKTWFMKCKGHTGWRPTAEGVCVCVCVFLLTHSSVIRLAALLARLWFRHAKITWAPWRAKDLAVSKPANRVWVGRQGMVQERNKMIKISHLTTITSQCSCYYLQQLNPSKGCMGPISWIHSPSDRKPKALIKLNQVHFKW